MDPGSAVSVPSAKSRTDPFPSPQAAGLLAVSLGLSRNFRDDHEMLKHGMVMYDALYAWCKEGQDETHT
ncbi:MAG TPA: chromate resistance protein ChrB domain-containing protein, partial [Ramlibacter sp.]